MAKHLSDAQLNAQIRRARAAERTSARTEPRARYAWFDEKKRRIVVELNNGCLFAFPTRLAQGLRGAPADKLREVKVYPGGSGLRWDTLDVDLGLSGLLTGVFGNRRWMAELGRIGGSVKSRAKAEAARMNGAKGGRPRGKST